MTIQEQIQQFLASPAFGVVGASTNRQKFGNKVLRCYLQNGRKAIPVNPNEPEIKGYPAQLRSAICRRTSRTYP